MISTKINNNKSERNNFDGSRYCVWDENKSCGVITLAIWKWLKAQTIWNIINSRFGLYLAVDSAQINSTRAKQINFLLKRRLHSIYGENNNSAQSKWKVFPLFVIRSSGVDELLQIVRKCAVKRIQSIEHLTQLFSTAITF